jgi:hypothetical protein
MHEWCQGRRKTKYGKERVERKRKKQSIDRKSNRKKKKNPVE